MIFDLDGTLIDTVPDLALSVDETLVALGLPPSGEAVVRTWVGDGIDALLERALAHAGAPAGLRERGLDLFRERYCQNNGRRSTPYAGARELLGELAARGTPLSCVTNKSSPFTLPLLAQFGFDGYFQSIVSSDTLGRRKPDPAPLAHACEQAGVAAADALLVGDSCNDVRAARAAGMPVWCVSYGYSHGEDVASYAPDRVLASLGEAAGYLRAGA